MQPTKSNQSNPTTKAGGAAESGLARFGLALANWSERWFPDPLVFALAGMVVGLSVRPSAFISPPANWRSQGGKSFWSLVPFTMQMVMIIIGGYVLATTPLVHRFIRGWPRSPRTGVQQWR